MRGRSSRAGGSKKEGMEIVKVDFHNKVKEEAAAAAALPPPHNPHSHSNLSGAYIRSLVKQLTSSKNKDIPTPDTNGVGKHGDGFGEEAMLSEDDGGQQLSLQPPPTQATQQHKKQVRRRLHTTRPYQERLLNMAEARREIVTALKFHRASMKQATGQPQSAPPPAPAPQPLLQLPPPPQPPQQSSVLQGKTKCRRNRRVYPSSSSTDSNFAKSGYSCSSFSSPNPYSFPDNYHEISHPPIIGNLNYLGISNQRPLGLNLNIQDFTNLEANLYHHNPSLSSSSSTSPSPTPNNNSAAILQQKQQGNNPSEINGYPCSNNIGINEGGLAAMEHHHGMDDEEMMEEMRWMGEQHQMEWNDSMNLFTSAWWFKFFKNTEEIGPNWGKADDDDDNDKEDDPFDQVMVEFPDWLNTANDQSCLDDSFQDPALPCMDMDIGEIEGMDGEWFA